MGVKNDYLCNNVCEFYAFTSISWSITIAPKYVWAQSARYNIIRATGAFTTTTNTVLMCMCVQCHIYIYVYRFNSII